MSSFSPETVIILVTGANAGIGKATVKRLATEHKNCHVIIGSRKIEAGEATADPLLAEGLSVSAVQLDLDSQESVAAAVKHIENKFGRLDVLINNAGILNDHFEKDLSTRELFTQTFMTNVIGTADLTEQCLPLLRKSTLPRIIFLSSHMGSLAEATNEDMPFFHWDIKAYDASKAAVNMLALNYARILKPDGGLVNAVCPGLVNTALTRHNEDAAPPELGAQRVVEIVLAGKDGPTATFSNRDGNLPW